MQGDLEILQGLAVAGIFGVNSTESEGEQTGIIREQIPSSSRAVMIFRGPLISMAAAHCNKSAVMFVTARLPQ
jgi:hypothetical protein